MNLRDCVSAGAFHRPLSAESIPTRTSKARKDFRDVEARKIAESEERLK